MGDQFADVDAVPSAGNKRKAEGDPDQAEPQLPAELVEPWTNVPRLGKQVMPSPFIPCKPPLQAMASSKLDEGDRFDATMFMERQVSERRDVGMIVCLLDQKRGIPVPSEEEWQDWDAEYVAITFTNAQEAAAKLQKACQPFLAKNPRRMVAVFCEDGTNLSGYCIVTYMHQVLSVSLQDALASFAASRAPGIFYQPYLEDLWQRFGHAAAPPGPAKPSWASDKLKIVPAHGEFALPPSRPAQPPPAAAPSSSSSKGGDPALPPGWTKHWSKTHNKPYYFNKATGKQSWDVPKEGSGSGGGSKEKGGGGGEQAGAMHLLVKHGGVRRPASWRDKEGAQIKGRTVAQAREIAQKHLDAIRAAPDPKAAMAGLAKTESDCSSAHKGGDLGMFKKGAMQKVFEDATWALAVGGLSELVETDSGVHVILRTA